MSGINSNISTNSTTSLDPNSSLSPKQLNKSSSFGSYKDETSSNSLMESFLEYSRNGNLSKVKEIIDEYRKCSSKNQSGDENDDDSILKIFNINYRGIHKRFYGWTALHLCCYFNQPEIVKFLLQQPDIDINITNNENDTPLHKAVHSSINSSRYDIVELLLLNNADINLKNNQGLKPIDLASDQSVKRLIEAAEKTENYNLQKQFFEAVTSNDLETINKLLKNKNFDINCTDTFGNTALHLASNRNQCETAILLIEKGINTILKNHHQLTALDLVKTREMKEIIGYVPYNHRKYQGYLLKKRKFLGFKEYFVVLNKGSIIYYSNEIDASHDQNRKGTYFLNNAFIKEYDDNGQEDYLAYSWTINYTNGKKHTLCSLIPYKRKNYDSENTSGGSNKYGSRYYKSKILSTKRTQLNPLERKKKWIEAIKEHIAYSDSKMQAQNNENQIIMPIESLQACLNALKIDEDKLNFLLIQIEQQFNSISQSELNQVHTNTNLYQVISNSKTNFESLKAQIKLFIENANKCLNLHEQRDSFLKSQLAESRSKCELLEQSLRVLAQENLELESKKLPKSSRPSSPTPALAPITDENENISQSSLSLNKDTEQNEEFFDIPDDPLTDEEDNQEDGSNLDNQSLALRSCYGSLTELNTSLNSKTETETLIDNQLGIVESEDQVSIKESVVIKAEKKIVKLDTDSQGWRLRLPEKMFDRSQISIWSILKQFIGKELSKIAMPAALCEPLSFLQRITENVYYSDLLNKASDIKLSPDPCKRMEYIAAFAVSSISSNIDRLAKPFNPLLGETFELVREDLGFRIICEQVSHHPPVSAFYTDSTNSNNWKYYGTVNPKIKFWGKSIEIQPKGTLTLELNNLNETYTWQTVTCCVHNIIVGKLWFEYYGTMEITCHQTGYKAILNFKPYSWSNKELHRVEGHIYDKKKNKVRGLYGYWTHCFYSCDVKEFDNYIKSNKKLPTVQLDQYFNDVNVSKLNIESSNLNKHINSEPDLNNLISPTETEYDNSNKSNNKIKFTLNEESTEENNLTNDNDKLLSNETQKRISIKKSEPYFNTTVSINAPEQLDLREIWRVVPRPEYAEEYYNFNYFTMTLNELKEDIEKVIAPTDSRFRSDIRQLELCDLDGASREKTRLEEKQRESRKNRKDDYTSKWFYSTKHQYTNEETYIFNNKYWQRDYKDCLDLY